MATRMNDEAKAFSEFLRGCPAIGEAVSGKTTTLTGACYRSDDAAKFVLVSEDGQVDIPVEAVQRFKVIDSGGLQAMVQLEVLTERISASTLQTLKELIKDPITDTRKETPFDTLKETPFDTTKEVPFDTRKETIFDTRKELIKEIPKEVAYDTYWEQAGPDWGQVVNPAAGGPGFAGAAAGAGMQPFVMATPHHASQAAVAMQPGAQAAYAGGYYPKSVAADPPGPHITRKELIKDPLADPITRKELVWETYVEGGPYTTVEGPGGLPGGGFGDPPVWNLPGLMF
jgi:hypothetical protein